MPRSFLWRNAARGAALLVASARLLSAQTPQTGAQRPLPFYTRLGSASHFIQRPAMSHDGRWVLFSTYEVGRSHIWVMPGTGGTPTQLTSGAHTDERPEWFPSGEEFAFISDRTKSIMALRFDRSAGRVVGAPRRITLERASSFAISPDGSSLAYVVADFVKDERPIRMVPTAGGKATTLTHVPNVSNLVMRFSPDGRHLYFSTVDRAANVRTLQRIAVEGGRPEEVHRFAQPGQFVASTTNQQLLLVDLRDQVRRGTVVTQSGDTTAVFQIPKNVNGLNVFGVTPDGRGLLVASNDVVAPIRMVRLDGSSRTIGDGRTYEWPFAWSKDGKRVVYTTDSAGYMVVNVDGSAKHVQRLAPANVAITVNKFGRIMFSSDLRYTSFAPDSQNGAETKTFYILDTKTNIAREVTRRMHSQPIITGGGDWYKTNHGEFPYAERKGDSVEIRGAQPTGETRLIRTFAREKLVRNPLAVEGDRVVYQATNGDSAILYSAITTGEAKALMAIRGRFLELVISPDAKWIAATLSIVRDGVLKTELAFIPLDPATGRARFMDMGDGGYEAVWTADSRAVFYLKADNNWTRMSVWRFPLRADEQPRQITKNETGNFWSYQLSPDERAVLIPAERLKGSTLYRVDLQQAAAAYREAKAKAGPRD